MIRIPFSARQEADSVGHATELAPEPIRSTSPTYLEDRLHLLEGKLEQHAEELKSNVALRIERIESRFDRALESLAKDADTTGADRDKIIEFASQNLTMHHLPAAAALDALNELNDTIMITRDHLDALGSSVAKMKRVMKK